MLTALSTDARIEHALARHVLREAVRSGDVTPVVSWLEAHPADGARARLFELLFSFGPLAGSLLNAVDRLAPGQRATLGEALGRAFALGAVRPDDVRRAVPEHWGCAAPDGVQLGMVEVIVLTGRPALVRTYLERELELAGGASGDPQRMRAVRRAYAALPADVQAQLRETHGEVFVGDLPAPTAQAA